VGLITGLNTVENRNLFLLYYLESNSGRPARSTSLYLLMPAELSRLTSFFRKTTANQNIPEFTLA
jgi:hypothetical protein